MSLISDADLAYMRATINEMLPDTCNLLTVTQTSDGQGGYTETWGTATANIACRLDYYDLSRIRNSEAIFGNALNPYEGFILTLPYNTTVTEQYRIEINSVQYNVTAVDNGKSWLGSVRCAVEKV